MLLLKEREEELRRAAQGYKAKLPSGLSEASGKVTVNAPYAVIVTPGRELADQVTSCYFLTFPDIFRFSFFRLVLCSSPSVNRSG